MAQESSSSKLFNDRSWHPGIRIRRIKMHSSVFLAYAELYESARIMADKMDEVLDHGEHRTIIEEGLQWGYKMPNVEAVRARNKILRLYLRAADPYTQTTIKDGVAECPAMTARNLHLITHQCGMMIDDICRNIRETDYMLWLRTLKRAGGAYLGPTSLQEMVDVWGHLITSTARHETLVPPRQARLPSNWLTLVV